ncbi:MAG: V-type ATP synthase subunit E family protein [Planctomycetota bacterium]
MAEDANEKKEALSQKILDDARKQAQRAIERAEREAQRIRDKAESDGKKEADSFRDGAMRRAQVEKTRIGAAIPIEVKRRILAAQENILDGLLDHGLHAAAKTAEGDPGRTLKALILDGALIIHEDQMTVEANEEDGARISVAMLNDVADEVRKRQGRSVALRLSDRRPTILGGAIVRSQSGRMVCDNSFEARLSRGRDELRLKLARILFDEEESK